MKEELYKQLRKFNYEQEWANQVVEVLTRSAISEAQLAGRLEEIIVAIEKTLKSNDKNSRPL